MATDPGGRHLRGAAGWKPALAAQAGGRCGGIDSGETGRGRGVVTGSGANEATVSRGV
jgi:hypothetical protein